MPPTVAIPPYSADEVACYCESTSSPHVPGCELSATLLATTLILAGAYVRCGYPRDWPQERHYYLPTARLSSSMVLGPRLNFPRLPCPPRVLYTLSMLDAWRLFLRSLTCVFLASKTEEQITNVQLLAKATGRDELQILGKELTLLQVGETRMARRNARHDNAGRGGETRQLQLTMKNTDSSCVPVHIKGGHTLCCCVRPSPDVERRFFCSLVDQASITPSIKRLEVIGGSLDGWAIREQTCSMGSAGRHDACAQLPPPGGGVARGCGATGAYEVGCPGLKQGLSVSNTSMRRQATKRHVNWLLD